MHVRVLTTSVGITGAAKELAVATLAWRAHASLWLCIHFRITGQFPEPASERTSSDFPREGRLVAVSAHTFLDHLHGVHMQACDLARTLLSVCSATGPLQTVATNTKPALSRSVHVSVLTASDGIHGRGH